jgi:hypothetical protein
MNHFTFRNLAVVPIGKAMLLFALLFCGLTTFAQVTTSTITGLVTDVNGDGLIGATVVATHVPSGTRYGSATNALGRFTLPAVRVGGPFTVTVSYTGFETATRENIYTNLGVVSSQNFELKESGFALGEVAITAFKNPLNTLKTGASTSISEDEIMVLPTVNRDLTDFIRLTPQANLLGDNVISIAGANNRYNAIYIDGAVNNDVFGLAGSGTNGGQTGISPISPDAIEQFQVVVAPYDVKLSGFAGGGINAVTRSGTNEVNGSAYWFTRNESLAGYKPSVPDSAAKEVRRLPNFSANTYGVRVGGPIVKDKVFFFINAEMQRDETPQPFDFANYNGNSSQAEIDAFDSRLREFGYDPGGYLSKVNSLNGEKILARFDFNLGQDHKLMLRHHYTKGTATYDQASFNNRIRFANNGIYFPTTTNSTALELTSVFGETVSNNLTIGYTTVRDDRDPLGSAFPSLEITDGAGVIWAGTEPFSTANALDQNILTLTDYVNFYLGNHTVTLGTSNEFFSIYNLFVRQSYGVYRYDSLAQFMNEMLPSRYLRSYSLVDNISEDGSAAAADFNAMQLGFYFQDEYAVSKRFTTMLGLRVDIPVFLDDPAVATVFNEEVLEQVSAVYDLQGALAGQAPESQTLFSPRIGFNYDVMGNTKFVVRGGVGIFTSRIPFVWPGGMFTNNGILIASVDAGKTDIANTPGFEFRPDANNQYTNEDFGKVGGSAQLDLFAKKFRYPQTFRTSLAFDVKLPWGMIGTVEGIYSKVLNNVTYQDVNVAPSIGRLQGGPDSRDIYNGSKISNKYTAIILGSNTNEGHSYNITGQLQKPFTNGWVGSVSYTFGESKTINDLTSSQNLSNWRFNESVNSRNGLPVSYSDFDLGHRINAFVSKRIEYGKEFGGATTISLYYNGQSGQRFSYTYSNRLVNDDSQNNQDLIFVPASRDQINLVDDAVFGTADQQWANLDEFINNDEYLSTRRGQYAERNGGRLPFTNILDLKVLQDVFMNLGGKRRTIQLSLDMFNFTNLLNKDWGRRYVVTNDNYSLIAVTRASASNTATYKFSKPKAEVWNIDESGISSSIWQAQLGVRLLF